MARVGHVAGCAGLSTQMSTPPNSLFFLLSFSLPLRRAKPEKPLYQDLGSVESR